MIGKRAVFWVGEWFGNARLKSFNKWWTKPQKQKNRIVTAEDMVTLYSNGERILVGIKHKAGRRALMAASPALAGKYPVEQLQTMYAMAPSNQEVTVKATDILAALARIRAVDAGVARVYSNKKSSVIESHQKDDE